MNSDAVLAFSASTASSLRFPSKANKEIKRASERRRGLSSSAERSEPERRRGTESLLLAGLSFYLSRLQILSDFCRLASLRQRRRGWTGIQNAKTKTSTTSRGITVQMCVHALRKVTRREPPSGHFYVPKYKLFVLIR